MTWGFERGKSYNRKRDIHERFSGQPRPGIITPANHAVVFLISGAAGLQHGYHDTFNADGSVDYFGMGTVGDMEMKTGNLAIATHSSTGKSLLLFRVEKHVHLRFYDEMICEGFQTVAAPDTTGTVRNALVFKLVPISAVEQDIPEMPDLLNLELDRLRELAELASKPASKGQKRFANVFERSQVVRAYVLKRAAGVCERCKCEAPFKRASGEPYLEPHHIRRLSDGGPDHYASIAALCPNCHRRAHSGTDQELLNKELIISIGNLEASYRYRRN